jgi:hypothetical protein
MISRLAFITALAGMNPLAAILALASRQQLAAHFHGFWLDRMSFRIEAAQPPMCFRGLPGWAGQSLTRFARGELAIRREDIELPEGGHSICRRVCRPIRSPDRRAAARIVRIKQARVFGSRRRFGRRSYWALMRGKTRFRTPTRGQQERLPASAVEASRLHRAGMLR